MQYTAATLTAAARPVVLTIGRARGGAWSRWWVRHCRTWTAHPLSVPQMLELQAARRDPAHYFVALVPILRAVLPFRWWYRVAGDPVRLLLGLPRELLEVVLKKLVTAPETDRDLTREDDDSLELLRKLQQRAVHGEQGDRSGVSLATAALSVRAVYGDAWYYNPKRWNTSDGYVPFAVALVEHAGIQALDLRRRLEVAEGTILSHAKPHERARVRRLAYPEGN